MNAKTMEGLAGARTNMDLLNTPFKVYKEARLRGDTAVMERAMGYVADFSNRADEYKDMADEGMKEDAKEAGKKAELEREKAIQKRREEREKLDERIEKSRDETKDADTVTVSEEGRVLLKELGAADSNHSNSNDSDNRNQDHTVSTSGKADKEPVIYTKTGEAGRIEQAVSISVSV